MDRELEKGHARLQIEYMNMNGKMMTDSVRFSRGFLESNKEGILEQFKLYVEQFHKQMYALKESEKCLKT